MSFTGVRQTPVFVCRKTPSKLSVDNAGSGVRVFTVGEKIENSIDYYVEGNVLKSVTVSINKIADLYVEVHNEDNVLEFI